MGAKLISVIGAPASGKTTLAGHLAAELPGRLVREDFEGNPFLAGSSRKAAARLGAELHFLLTRVSQLSQDCWSRSGAVVSDYGFCSSGIFARANLTRAELAVYQPLHERLTAVVKQPDVMVLLTAPPRELRRRVCKRGRTFERRLSAEFLSTLQRSYRQAAAKAACPIIEIDTATCDLRLDEPRQELIQRLRNTCPGLRAR